jgi:hypothetical protein
LEAVGNHYLSERQWGSLPVTWMAAASVIFFDNPADHDAEARGTRKGLQERLARDLDHAGDRVLCRQQYGESRVHRVGSGKFVLFSRNSLPESPNATEGLPNAGDLSRGLRHRLI